MLSKYWRIACGAAVMSPALAMHAWALTQPATVFTITVDGQFAPANEWSDVTPSAFISNPSGATPTALGNPNANSYLYAAIGPGAVSNDALYLLYDYGGRTVFFTSEPVGAFIADVKFPFRVHGVTQFITVQLRNSNTPGTPDVKVDVNGDGLPDFTAAELGLEAALGFGSSPHIPGVHEIVELEVPLNIPANFGPGFPSGGLQGDGHGDGYDPAPAFWGAAAQKDAGDPPISSGIFQINPDASLTIIPIFTPEPASLSLLGLGALLMLRRRR